MVNHNIWMANMDEEELELKKQLKLKKKEELAKRKRQREIEGSRPLAKPQNTAIYISNLPVEGVTVDDLITEFSKYGMIKKDSKDDQYKCKIYSDSSGKPKGDALLVYVRPESPAMAIEMMNGYTFRGQNIKVELAQFDQELNNYKEEPKEYKRRKTDTSAKLENNLLNWSEDSDEKSPNAENDHTVILANILDMYAEFQPQEIADIARDIREGCEVFGEILFFKFDELLAEAHIQFATLEAAQKCREKMNNRYFDGRKIRAYLANEDISETLSSSEDFTDF